LANLKEDAATVIENPLHRAIYLTGPTASGKTAVGIALAQTIGAEVIALDSMTLYRGMDIGTAKPTIEERQGVPHHLIDVLDPWESSSVADYRNWAITCVHEIEGRGNRPLFVGGTPMYLKILLRGIFEGPAADSGLRAELEARSTEDLQDILARVDPLLAAKLHANDRRRIIRAIEVHRLTGRALSEFQKEHDRPAKDVKVFAIERPRSELYERINLRVELMYQQGLVDEVRRLIEAPQPIGETAGQGVGYRETIGYLRGEMSLVETIALVQTRTRQFAKRQGTWFRGLAEVRALPMSNELVGELVRLVS
jgi:tRNA dimethylallyltransferase